jgi:DNA-binding response OmpR family regulator
MRFYQYDLAIFDWSLPQMSGIEILHEIRKLGLSTPVIMLTGRNTIVDKEEGLA